MRRLEASIFLYQVVAWAKLLLLAAARELPWAKE
jgi:hypothetical protein